MDAPFKLPLRLESDGNIYSADKVPYHVGRIKWPGDDAFIVTAVNDRERLVKALREGTELFQHDTPKQDQKRYEAWRDRARALLAEVDRG